MNKLVNKKMKTQIEKLKLKAIELKIKFNNLTKTQKLLGGFTAVILTSAIIIPIAIYLPKNKSNGDSEITSYPTSTPSEAEQPVSTPPVNIQEQTDTSNTSSVPEYTFPKETVDHSNWIEYKLNSDHMSPYANTTFKFNFMAPNNIEIIPNQAGYTLNGNGYTFTFNMPNEGGAYSYSECRNYENLSTIGIYDKVIRFNCTNPLKQTDTPFFRFVSNPNFNSDQEFRGDLLKRPVGGTWVSPLAIYQETYASVFIACEANNPSYCDDILKGLKIEFFYTGPSVDPISYPTSYSQ
jgi:hypothetical protein